LTIVRWTGRGALGDLAASVKAILSAEGLRRRVSVLGSSVLVEGPDTIRVAGLLENLPGSSWIAVGRRTVKLDDLARETAGLAKIYVRPKSRFAVLAESTVGDVKASDLMGLASSAVLEAVKGARVNEENPSVVFRVAYDQNKGFAAVQLRAGPGGRPTGDRIASCLVSGGPHSSVVAWKALLAGYALELVHAKVDDRSLRAVALLYSELSNRVDPRKLSLVVFEGGSVGRVLSKWTKGAGRPAFAGFHAGRGRAPPRMGSVTSPLFLLEEEEFEREFGLLGIREDDRRQRWSKGGAPSRRTLRFSGTRADVHGVMAGLR